MNTFDEWQMRKEGRALRNVLIQRKKTFMIIGLILLLAFGLRTFQLSTEGLWTDEAVTLLSVKADSFGAVYDTVGQNEITPFLYQLLLNWWGMVFGHGIFTLRFFSVIFGTLSVWLMYLLAKEVFAAIDESFAHSDASRRLSKRAPLIAALLMATSVVQVVFSQEMRLYAFYNFLALVSLYLTARIIRTKGTRMWTLIAYVVVSWLLAYTNYLFVVLNALEFMFIAVFFIKEKRLVRRFLYCQLASALAVIPLVPLATYQTALVQAEKLSQFVSLGLPESLAKLGLLIFAIPIAIASVIFIIAMVWVKRKTDSERNILVKSESVFHIKPKSALVGLLIFIAAYLFLLDYLIKSFFIVRYISFLLPLLYIFFAYVISTTRKGLAGLLLIGLLVLNIIALSAYYVTPTKIEWQRAVDFIRSNSPTPTTDSRKETFVFAKAGIYVMSFEQYYPYDFDTINISYVPAGSPNRFIIPKDELFSALDNLNGMKGFWMVMPRMKGEAPLYIEDIKQEFRITKQASFHEIDVAFYERRKQ